MERGDVVRAGRECDTWTLSLGLNKTSVAVAGIDALAGLGPAVGLAFLAGVLIIRIAIVLRPFDLPAGCPTSCHHLEQASCNQKGPKHERH